MPENAKDGDPPHQPATLRELLQMVMDQRGYRSLLQLSKHGTIPHSTLYSWWTMTRNSQRPPKPERLQQFADDFGVAPAIVFHAAGRAAPHEDLDDADAVQVMHLYRELSPDDRRFAEHMLRELAERNRNSSVTRRL